MIPLILFALVVVQVGIGLLWAHRRAHRLSTRTWDQLLAKLEPFGLPPISMTADISTAPNSSNELGSEDLWELLGGLEGLRRMDNNAKIMMALAGYMEHRNNLPNMILAERMRHDGAIVRKVVRSMRLARYMRTHTRVMQVQLREAARSYNAMKHRLPALYEMSHGSLYPELLGM